MFDKSPFNILRKPNVQSRIDQKDKELGAPIPVFVNSHK